jgi:hypothetical protein
VALALASSAAAHAWVLVPAAVRLVPAQHAKLDITTELYGWPDAIAAVREILSESTADDVAVVGPHWVVCAQLHAALGREARVGCSGPGRDDFDDWEPKAAWRAASTLVHVTDARFDVDFERTFPRRAVAESRRVAVARGGRVVREFRVTVLTRSASARR